MEGWEGGRCEQGLLATGEDVDDTEAIRFVKYTIVNSIRYLEMERRREKAHRDSHKNPHDVLCLVFVFPHWFARGRSSVQNIR
jgi:hypothetical protein